MPVIKHFKFIRRSIRSFRQHSLSELVKIGSFKFLRPRKNCVQIPHTSTSVYWKRKLRRSLKPTSTESTKPSISNRRRWKVCKWSIPPANLSATRRKFSRGRKQSSFFLLYLTKDILRSLFFEQVKIYWSKRKVSYFKGFHVDITTWTPYLVVAYLGFASRERNTWQNANC